MSDYIITNDGELMHYGVPGMKWGVRRASKQLSKATTKEDRDKALGKLNKHRSKASAKIEKLTKKRVQLQKDVDRHVLKSDVKAAKLDREIGRLKQKSMGIFTSERRAQKLLTKAMELEVKSEVLRSRSNAAKSRLAQNETMTRLFQMGIDDIDAIVKKHKR